MIPNINPSASLPGFAPSPSLGGEGAFALGSSSAANAALEGALAPAAPASEAPALSSSKEAPSDPRQAQELADRVNELLAKDTNMSLRFDLTESNEVRSFQLVDRDTNEVIMQYPSKEALSLRDRLEAAAEGQRSAQPAEPALASGLLLSTRA